MNPARLSLPGRNRLAVIQPLKIAQHIILVLTGLGLACSGLGCDDQNDTMQAANPTSRAGDSFLEIGATIYLPATGSQSTIEAYVTDFDEDNQAEGLDVAGGGQPEFLFIGQLIENTVGIDIDGDRLVDYYITAQEDPDKTIILNDVLNDTQLAYAIVVDADGNLVGIDRNGDGLADDDRLTDLFADSTPPLVVTDVPSGIYSADTQVGFFCTDNYACNHVVFSLSGPGASADGIIIDFSSKVTVGAGQVGEYTLNFYAVDFAGNRSTEGQTQLTINSAGLVISGSASLTTGEDGSIDQFSIALSSQPTSQVTVQITSSNTAEAVVTSASSLTFTVANFNSPQTVTIQGVDDSAAPVKDGPQSYSITLNPSGPEDYNLLNNQTVLGQNLDNELYLFVSNTFSDGDLGGVSGADTICNTDSRRPDPTLTYKALLSGGGRIGTTNPGTSDGQSDWVLEPLTNYMRLDGTTLIFQSDANSLFDFSSNFNASPEATSPGIVWSGMNNNWTDTFNCDGWTDGTGGEQAKRADPELQTAQAIALGNSSCNAPYHLYCVEQP